MTNKIFIDELAKETGRTKKETKEFVDSFEIVLKKMVGSEKLKVVDLTFAVKDVAARTGVNPQTQEKIEIPASKRLSVRASNDFKNVIKG